MTIMVAARDGGAAYHSIDNVSYIGVNAGEDNDAYRTARCKLDMYLPGNAGFATIVFFHGGGLEMGEKFIPEMFKHRGLAVVAPNYRLSPKATNPAYTDDAAEAVAWTLKHIAQYGGDPRRVYVCGHSAGGYLTLMLALDKSYLAKYGVDADSITGYVPFSGQTNTHFTIKKERHLDMDIPIIDSFAPINHARKLATHMALITGDRHKEMLARYTENLHLQDILRAKGSEVPFYELNGFDHGSMVDSACLLMLNLIAEWSKK